MTYSTYKLNKQSGNIQPWPTPFSILNQSFAPCPVLTIASWPANTFVRRQVRWYGIPISLIIFHSFLWSTRIKGFSTVSEAVDVFLKFSCFFYDSTDFANLTSGSSAFSKFSWHIWKFLGHMLLKPSLKVSEQYLASMWNECNFVAVWTFFGISLLWDWNENWPFLILWPLLSFPSLLAYWLQYFNYA